MTRYALVTAVTLAMAGVASAQFQQPYYGGMGGAGGYPPSAFMPNIYNPQNQPLSPYLNLLRGGNAGVNYYYGVRPGTMGGMGFGYGAPFMAFGGNRPLFFPELANAPEPLEPREADSTHVLPPAGHPVFFNNTMGYFPSPFGNRRGGYGGGGYGGFGRPGGSGSTPPVRK